LLVRFGVGDPSLDSAFGAERRSARADPVRRRRRRRLRARRDPALRPVAFAAGGGAAGSRPRFAAHSCACKRIFAIAHAANKHAIAAFVTFLQQRREKRRNVAKTSQFQVCRGPWRAYGYGP